MAVVKVGVMGGTFDPIHKGHLAIAEEARCKLSLEFVLFLPAGRPWLKSSLPVTDAEHRYEMVRLATSDRPYFRLSRMEVDRPGPSYTVESLSELKRELGDESRLFLLLGSDSVSQFPQWRDARRIIELAEIVGFPRPGFPRPNLEVLEEQVPGIKERIVLLDSPVIDISSTEIRKRVAMGQSIAGLVPESVEEYIKEHGLYAEAL